MAVGVALNAAANAAVNAVLLQIATCGMGCCDQMLQDLVCTHNAIMLRSKGYLSRKRLHDHVIDAVHIPDFQSQDGALWHLLLILVAVGQVPIDLADEPFQGLAGL